MNLRASMWSALGVPADEIKRDPQLNIQAGAELLARIRDRLPDASPDKIATLYNSLAKDQVTDYGARVQQVMRDKPWERRDHTFDPFLKLRIPSP